MTGLSKKYSDLQCRRQQRALERWEQVREKGVVRFALRQSVIFPVMITVISDFNGYIFDGHVPVFRTRLMIFYWFIGIVAGFFGWSTQENKYQRALANRRQSFGDSKIVLR
jgi:ribosomal protein S19